MRFTFFQDHVDRIVENGLEGFKYEENFLEGYLVFIHQIFISTIYISGVSVCVCECVHRGRWQRKSRSCLPAQSLQALNKHM